MKLRGNARTCLHSRRLIVERVVGEGWTLTRAAEAAGVSVRTVSKWLARFRAEGAGGLLDRSSAPACVPHRTREDRVELIALLRRLRGGDRRDAVDAALDGFRCVDPDRAREALSARAAGAC